MARPIDAVEIGCSVITISDGACKDCDYYDEYDGICNREALTTEEKISALLSALEELGGGWRPIETAPMNKPIIVCRLGVVQHIIVEQYKPGVWYLCAYDTKIEDPTFKPEWWMPLPPKPKE